jgi:hypothetical protein
VDSLPTIVDAENPDTILGWLDAAALDQRQHVASAVDHERVAEHRQLVIISYGSIP